MHDSEEFLKEVVVIGASGFGRESLDVLTALIDNGGKIKILGVFDDYPSQANLQRLSGRGIAYLGTIDDYIAGKMDNVEFILGIGSPKIRATLAARLEAEGLRAFTAVHPSAVIGTKSILERGVVICAGAVVSTNVYLGRHVHINPNATIGHDSILHDFVSINPAAVISGEVQILTETLVGASATVLQGIVLGSEVVVGASACVTKAVESGRVVKGVPAK